jgi:hypothetical protein
MILRVVADAFGKVGVEATQFVPSATNILLVPVAVDGNVAVVQVGSVEILEIGDAVRKIQPLSRQCFLLPVLKERRGL